jgi:iron complex transport system substrate-binding protein
MKRYGTVVLIILLCLVGSRTFSFSGSQPFGLSGSPPPRLRASAPVHAAASAPPRQAQPSRIISLIPAVTEMLFAIGAGDRVVGVSSYDRFPAEVATRERVGALLDPNVERILALKPDLVVVYGTQQELIARLARAGVPRFDYQHAGLADITTTIRRLGERVGRTQDAATLATRIERDIQEIRQRVAGRPRPKTVLLFDREPGSLRGMYASAGIGFMHDMLEVAGGVDAFDDIKRQSLQLSAEMLLARAPEVIIEVQSASGWTPERIEKERAIWKTLAAVPAVRTGRIHILADDRLSIPGPRVVEAIRLLVGVLHPGVQFAGAHHLRQRSAGPEGPAVHLSGFGLLEILVRRVQQLGSRE